MKIISWNVNGIRASRRKNFNHYISQQNPDVICVQETKAQKQSLSVNDYSILGYKLYWSEAKKAGYSGVATWVRESIPVLSIKENIGCDDFDNEGRTVIVEFSEFYLINSYYPNGRDDLSRVDFKLKYSYLILEISKKLEKIKPVILTGDFNTAHCEQDLARPKENEKNTGFLMIERAFLDNLVKENFIDAFRYKYPDKKDVYSWWSYRGGAKYRNVGWRIDYFWMSKSLASKIKAISYHVEENSSDHCPVVLELNYE